jgi:hypothetical protein
MSRRVLTVFGVMLFEHQGDGLADEFATANPTGTGYPV